jgi:F0F1-type ATP synthase assembly protein I
MAEPKPDTRVGKWWALSQVGLEMVLPIFLGVWIDSHMGWTPWATVGGAALGFGGGLFHLVTLSRSIDETPENREENSP